MRNAAALTDLDHDQAFDRLLAPEWYAQSLVHWTPYGVCARAVSLLRLKPTERVLDIGSGVGKFCALASMLGPGTFVGVEQRGHLVREAQRVAASLGSRARFIHANALDLDWNGFDALYFYNPFDETRFDESLRIDATIAFGDDVFWRFARGTFSRLRRLPVGTRVLTYHGVGVPMPPSYCRVEGEGDLWLYVKEQRG